MTVAKGPDRTLAIERLLREPASGSRVASEGPCVTAEELAAWVDGGLATTEALRVEAHLASCAACQALLSAFAATQRAVDSSPTRSLTRLLVPFAAAAVLVVGVWLTGVRRDQAPPASTAAPRTARLEAPAQTAEPASRPQAVAVAPRAAPASPAAPPSAPARRPAAPAAPDARSERPSAELLQRDLSGPLPAPEANAAAETDARPRQAEAAGPPARAEAFAASARLAASQAKGNDVRAPWTSPDGASRWRITGAALEASADGGVTWLPAAGVPPAELANVTSATSPARGVSWVVGRGGLVFVTADGVRFTRGTSPALAPLTGVEAVDASTAEVRSADGRAWRTTDGGRTWAQVR
jgi:hypothetical protein